MKTVTVPAHAKINLTLDITGVRDDGYHLLRSIMHEIGLCDRVTVSVEESDRTSVQISSDKGYIPCDERNTAYKAAAVFINALGRPLHVSVHVEKHVPVGAGMGGGSSDAAAVLKALNRLTGAGFSEEKLCELGLKVGADVPFCIVGGTAVVSGIGEKLEPVPRLPKYPVVICKPKSGASTPVIYREYDSMGGSPDRPDNAAAERFARLGDVISLCRECKNVLTAAASRHRPEIPEIKAALSACGALAAEMSGSGSAVFGIFELKEKAKAAAKKLGRGFDTVILTEL